MKTTMKKSIFFIAGLVGLSLAACDDTSDLGKPQINEKPVVVKAEGIVAQASAIVASGSVNLNDYENRNMPLLNVAIDNTFPESATVVGTMQVADNEEFSNPAELPISLEEVAGSEDNKEGETDNKSEVRNYNAVVEGNLFEDAFVGFYGNDPATKDCWYRYILYIQDGTQVSELTGDYVDGRKISVTPVDQKLDIADHYYIYGRYIGGNSHKSAVEMSHSDKHKYDDPLFSYVAQVTAETVKDFTWKVTDNNKEVGTVYGVEDPAASTGRLIPLSEGGVAGQLTTEGNWKIEVNMLTKTYQITLAADGLYVFGAATGNGFGSRAIQLPTEDYVTYSGVGVVKGSFRLAAQKSANHGVVYGMGDAIGKLAEGLDTPVIEVEGTKKNTLVKIDANIVALTYNTAIIENIGICGALNDWDQTNPELLKANSTMTQWSATVSVAAGQEEFKFVCNEAWDINWGGTLDHLKAGGDNLKFPGEGTYKVTLDFSTIPYSATIVKND